MIKDGDYVAQTACPFCGKKNDLHRPVEGNDSLIPTAGAISLCVTCLMPSLYEAEQDGKLFLRMPTERERQEIIADPDFQDAMFAIIYADSGKGKRK